MNNYHNFLPMGENFAEPPTPHENPERIALLDLYESLRRAAILSEDNTPLREDLADARDAVRQRLSRLGLVP